MGKNIIISKKERCGSSQKTTRMLENVKCCKSFFEKNWHITYNKDGVKDGIRFQPCSDKFVDSLILRVLVADYLIHKEKLCQSWIDKQNNTCYFGEKQARKVQSKNNLFIQCK